MCTWSTNRFSACFGNGIRIFTRLLTDGHQIIKSQEWFLYIERRAGADQSAIRDGFSYRMETMSAETHLVKEPKDVWLSSFSISRNSVSGGKILFNWNGDIILSSHFDDKSVDWIAIRKGFLAYQFEVEDTGNRYVIVIKHENFEQRTFRFHYRVNALMEILNENECLELLTYVVFYTKPCKYKQDNLER